MLVAQNSLGSVCPVPLTVRGKPNAEIVRVVHRGLLRVVIVAREAIAPGGQVLVDYGDAYWRASSVAPRPLPRILADVGTDRYRF